MWKASGETDPFANAGFGPRLLIADFPVLWGKFFDAMEDAVVLANSERVYVKCNRAAARLLGAPIDRIVGRRVDDFIPADLLPELDGHWMAFLDAGSNRGEFTIVRPDGTCRTVDYAATAHVGPGIHISVMRDITERKEAERQAADNRAVEQARLKAAADTLLAELSHRVKNTLAVVQAIAHQTLRRGNSLDDFEVAFGGRLQALAIGHELLIRGNWEAVDLRLLIERSIAAVRPASADGAVEIRGPDIALSPKASITLALVVHELATNAARHGALSTAAGRVTIDWDRLASPAAGGGTRLHLRWVEQGGPPIADAPAAGLGITLIRRAIGFDLDGTAAVSFHDEGLFAELSIPLIDLPRI